MSTSTILTPRPRRRTGVSHALISLVLPVLIVVVWWFASAQSTSPYFPPLSRIWAAFVENWISPRILTDVAPSLGRMFAGFAIAVIVGVALGALLGRVRVLYRALNPVLQFLRALPTTALVPISIVLLGIGDTPKIALIAFGSLFPVLLNTIDGVRNIDAVLVDVAGSYRLTRVQRLRHVQLPAAAPQVVAGIRTALTLAFVMMVVTELFGATNGIGYVTQLAQQGLRIPLMWSGMLLLGALGVAVNGLFVLMERRLLRWYRQDRED